jgi:hypothetical protein
LIFAGWVKGLGGSGRIGMICAMLRMFGRGQRCCSWFYIHKNQSDGQDVAVYAEKRLRLKMLDFKSSRENRHGGGIKTRLPVDFNSDIKAVRHLFS